MKTGLWCACVALACGTFARDARAEWPRIDQKLKNGQVSIHKVVILPAQVAYRKVGFKGVQGGAEIGDTFAAGLYSAAAKEISLRGVDVLPNPLQAANTDAERYAIADLQTRYDNVALRVRKKDHEVEHGRMTLDDRVARFAPAQGSDAIVFLRAYGQNMVPIGTLSIEPFLAEVAFVDAKSGEVLAFVRFSTNPGVIKNNDEKLAHHLRDVLRDIPLPSAPPRK